MTYLFNLFVWMPNFSLFNDFFQLISYPLFFTLLLITFLTSRGGKIARDILIGLGAGTTAYVNMGGRPPRRNNDEERERREAEAKRREEEAEQQRLENERRLAEQSEATKNLNERVAKLEESVKTSSK